MTADDVKEDCARATPISKELLVEVRDLPSNDGSVFCHVNGKPVKTVRDEFNTARKRIGMPDLIPHDLRRACIRRWESAGVSRGAAMQACGHAPDGVDGQYAQLSEAELVEVFVKAGIVSKPRRLQLVHSAG